MSGKTASTDHRKLRANFEELRAAGWAPLLLHTHPDYPEEPVLIPADGFETDEDWGSWYAYCARLLQRAYEAEPTAVEGEVLLQKASNEGRRGHRTALYRLDVGVCQISDKQPHDQHTEVLGRMGVVTILIEQLEERFRKSNLPRPLTVTDLARLTTENEDLVETRQKFFSSLNKGHFVNEQMLRSVATALGADHKELCFSSRSLYTPEARRKRAVSARERSRKTHEALRSFKPELKRLTGVAEIEILERLLQVPPPRSWIEYQFLPTDQAKVGAVETFVDVIRSTDRLDPAAIQNLCKALRTLEGAGIWVWFGEYEAGLEYIADVDEWGRFEPRLVIALGERDGTRPPLQVNVSGTAGIESYLSPSDPAP
ncbi:MAG TPA: hypothetical protein VGU24_21315 [Microvirga sp.]|jgi:hypothetical protein|nr:hypothetical protein [Microvirga sp.]